MFFMRKKRSGFACGVMVGAVASIALGGALMMTNKTIRKEANKEFSKLCSACHDLCGYMH